VTRTINQAGQDLIRFYEGQTLNRYADSVGYATIGIGHKITSEDNIGDTITQEQCEQLFQGDLSNAASGVERLVTATITDNQFAALGSFVFNLGPNALERSTLLKCLNAGDTDAAANEFLKWVYAGAVISQGLVERRAAEKQLFNT
jgi:GH24 family phage-related lysozyme (muramidase)